VPCWTRSTETGEIKYNVCVTAKLTRIGLNTGGYLARPYVIKEGNILTQNGLKIVFSQPLGTDLSSVNPYVHIYESAEKRGNTWYR